MAVTFDAIWTGAADNLWTNAGNWSGGVPLVNEDVLIPAGNWNIDCTAMTDLQQGVLHIAPGFTGSVGTSGTRCTSSFTEIKHNGAGKLWFVDGSGATTAVKIQGSPGADVADLDGVITLIHCKSGITTLASTQGILPNLFVSGDASVVLEGSANVVTALTQWGGSIRSSREITTANIHNGATFTQLAGSAKAVTTFNIYPGASVNYENATTVTLVNGFGGRLDTVRNRKASVTLTTVDIHAGFQFVEDGNMVTVTNRNPE